MARSLRQQSDLYMFVTTKALLVVITRLREFTGLYIARTFDDFVLDRINNTLHSRHSE